jgi:hypothetical protein
MQGIVYWLYWKVATYQSRNAADEKTIFALERVKGERGEHSISCQSGKHQSGHMRHGDGYCATLFHMLSLPVYASSEAWKLLPLLLVSLSLSFSLAHTVNRALSHQRKKMPPPSLAECSKNLYRLKNMRQRRARWGIFEYPPFTGRITLARTQTRTRHHLLLRSPFVFASGAKSCRMNISRSRFLLESMEWGGSNKWIFYQKKHISAWHPTSSPFPCALKRWIALFFSNLICM